MQKSLALFITMKCRQDAQYEVSPIRECQSHLHVLRHIVVPLCPLYMSVATTIANIQLQHLKIIFKNVNEFVVHFKVSMSM
jgi:hypothetical protein